MESVFETMKREEASEKLWNSVSQWSTRDFVNFITKDFPISFIEDITEKAGSVTITKETINELAYRKSLKDKFKKIAGPDHLDISVEKLIEEISNEMPVSAVDAFIVYLEKSGEEICRTWRPKLVMIDYGRGEGQEFFVYGYFKTDITEEELKACHRSYKIQNEWDFECNIPKNYTWKLCDHVEEPNAVSKGAGWIRYKIGILE